MSIRALQDYTVYAKYARYIPEKKRRETWEEQIERTFAMHEKKFAKQLQEIPAFRDDFEFAKKQVLKKRVLGSQRNLQFAGPQLEKHNEKGYNCSFSHCDRLRFFQECMYLLLCGCGVGVSVQKHHIAKLPELVKELPDNTKPVKFYVEDSIEGWSDAIGAVVSSFHTNNELSGTYFEFDYSKVRPEGSLISGGFKAPGPKGLASSIEKIRTLLEVCIVKKFKKLRTIDAFDIVMHSADAVLSGGVRRSAVLTMFSVDDDMMMNAKVGNWFIENPQRGRSNNSAALLKGRVTREQFHKLMMSTKEFGEPGFIWVDDLEIGYNPCCVASDSIVTSKINGVECDITIVELIEHLNGGDSVDVQSVDIETNKKSWESVLAGDLTRKNSEMVEIFLEDGKSLKCTPDHRIFTTNRGYVFAKDLTENDDIFVK